MPTQRGEPGIETRCRAGDVEYPHILGYEPGETPHERQELGVRRRGSDARVGVRKRIHRHVDMCDLTGGVHAGVGASGRPQLHPGAKHRRQSVVEHTGHGALPGLRRPARELGSVVGDIEPKTNKPATGVDGGLCVMRDPPSASRSASCRLGLVGILVGVSLLVGVGLCDLGLGLCGLALLDRGVLGLDLFDGLLGTDGGLRLNRSLRRRCCGDRRGLLRGGRARPDVAAGAAPAGPRPPRSRSSPAPAR